MIWLIGQMWLLLLLAFGIGAAAGWWAREPSLRRPARRPAPTVVPVTDAPRAAPTAPRPAEGPADDLTRIQGIGPHYARLLGEQGITTYAQLADMSPAEAAWLDDRLGAGERIEREDWRGQAKGLLGR